MLTIFHATICHCIIGLIGRPDPPSIRVDRGHIWMCRPSIPVHLDQSCSWPAVVVKFREHPSIIVIVRTFPGLISLDHSKGVWQQDSTYSSDVLSLNGNKDIVVVSVQWNLIDGRKVEQVRDQNIVDIHTSDVVIYLECQLVCWGIPAMQSQTFEKWNQSCFLWASFGQDYSG